MANIGKLLKVYFLLWAGLALCLSASWEERYKEGEKFFNEKNYSKAIAIFSEILKRPEKDELSAKSALKLGQCYIVFKDYEKARQLFREAEKWGGDIGEQARIGTALTYMNEGKNDLAIDILSKVISSSQSDENLAYAYYDRALCYKEKNWIRKAIDDLKEAKKRAKNNQTLLKTIEDELSKCESIYEEFQVKENSYLERVRMESLGGDFDACANLLRELARLCEEWGEMDKAIDYEKQAVDYSTSEEFKAGSLMNIGWRYCKEGKFEEAGQAFQQVADAYPQSSYAPEALLRAGDMFSTADKREEARKCYQALLQRYPQDTRVPSALMNLAFLSGKESNIEQMESLIEELIKNTPESELHYFALGYLDELRGKYEEAIEAYEKCASFGGVYFYYARAGIGISLFNLGKRGNIKKLEESFNVYSSLIRDENTPLPVRNGSILMAVRASLDYRMDRGIGYKQLWSLRDVLLSEDAQATLWSDVFAPLYLALSRCYLQVGDKGKAIELWSQTIKVRSSGSIFLKVFSILHNKFAPILVESSLPSGGEKALDYCRFSEIDNFFSPKGREYPQVVLVYGTSGSSAQKELYEKVLQNLVSSDLLLTFPQDKLKVVKDVDAKEEDLKKANLLLLGSASDNAIIEKVKATLPIKLGNKLVEIRDRKYEGEDLFVVMSVPNPLNKDKEAIIIWSANPSSFPGSIDSLFQMPFGYMIFAKGFSLEEDNILEAGFFYESPDRTYEPF